MRQRPKHIQDVGLWIAGGLLALVGVAYGLRADQPRGWILTGVVILVGAVGVAIWRRTRKVVLGAALVAGMVGLALLGGALLPATSTPLLPEPKLCPNAIPSAQGGNAALSVDLYVRRSDLEDKECWASSIVLAQSPARITYELAYRNTSSSLQSNVTVRVELPPGVSLIPHTTFLANSNYPQGKAVDTDAIASAGIVVGGYLPGGTAYLKFDAISPYPTELACGTTTLRVVGTVQPENMDYYYNTADILVTRDCSSSSPLPSK